jgi:hypothetical protein
MFRDGEGQVLEGSSCGLRDKKVRWSGRGSWTKRVCDRAEVLRGARKTWIV